MLAVKALTRLGICMHGSRVFQRGPTLMGFFLFFFSLMSGGRIQIPQSVPPAFLMAFRWRADDGPTLVAL